jgi:hypothetical protein
MKINDLPSEFFLIELQKERLTALPQYIVQNHIQVVNHNGTFYHLNPDLVFNVNQIVLCHVCAVNPMTKDQESIAAGNNYGRLGSLKPLNGTTQNACVPVRLYNIDLQIQANHSMNHSIAFPMNGPMECLKKIPCLDEKYCPKVTFLRPRDEWMKKAGTYKYLYKMDTDIAYNWLWVWVNANHPSFQNCIIDNSDTVHDGLNHVTEKIIEEAIMTTDPDIIGISLVLDAKDEENSEGMCNIDHEAASPYIIHTAVLPKPSLIIANVNSAITAMFDIVQPKNYDVNEDATYDEVLPHEKYAQNQPIIPVSRESNEPIVEWTDNKTLLTGAFPDKFFLVKVFLLDCQLNKIGNIFLSIMMVNSMILYSLLKVSINCSVHVAFITWLESLAKL